MTVVSTALVGKEFALKFATADERNKFANRFEAACREIAAVHLSY